MVMGGSILLFFLKHWNLFCFFVVSVFYLIWFIAGKELCTNDLSYIIITLHCMRINVQPFVMIAKPLEIANFVTIVKNIILWLYWGLN